jgi:hypothetical protein
MYLAYYTRKEIVELVTNFLCDFEVKTLYYEIVRNQLLSEVNQWLAEACKTKWQKSMCLSGGLFVTIFNAALRASASQNRLRT